MAHDTERMEAIEHYNSGCMSYDSYRDRDRDELIALLGRDGNGRF